MTKDRFEPDAATLVSDDELLDALGRGERPAGDDTLALAFALWRDDIVAPAAPLASPPPQPAKKFILSKKFRWGVISGVVAVAIGGGLTVAAAKTAEAVPGQPMYGIAQKWFPEQAKKNGVSATQSALGDARTAIAGQDLDLADRKLKDAEFLIQELTSLLDQQALQALQTDLDQVRGLLATARATLGTVVPPGGVPGLPVPTPGPSGGNPPTPNPGVTPTPSPGQTGGLLPPLPSLLPSLPLPQISLPRL